MVKTMTVEFRSIDGTEAAIGIAGSHAVIADRPEGTAGGLGLGFNGGQLLALAIGGVSATTFDTSLIDAAFGLRCSKFQCR